MNIQWYPGHMTKAKRQMTENAKKVDGVLEVLDSRIPLSSRNPDFDEIFAHKKRLIVLNKSDLADQGLINVWIDYYKQKGIDTIELCATKKNDKQKLIQFIKKSLDERIQHNKNRGIKKDIKLMIVGIPNSGKSTVINLLASQASAKTGNKPGVTRGQQIIRVAKEIVLLDTPGVLWPKFEDERKAMNLALTGAIKEQVLDIWELATYLVTKTPDRIKNLIKQRYSLDAMTGDAMADITEIAKKRGFLLKGGEYDIERAAQMIITEFKNGVWGKIVLETPEEFDQ
ncbi:MAG: ribosome biogenesis GTPase YlqF [Eubacteriales bacterium]